MNEIDKSLPPADSFGGELLALIAMTGEFPATQADRLTGSPSYHEKLLLNLKQERFIRSYVKNGLRGYRLTAPAKRLLLSQFPTLLPFFTGNAVTNAPKYDVKRRLRLHNVSSVLVTMHNAGVAILPWEKPDVFQLPKQGGEVSLDRPTFYTSREVKAVGPRGKNVTSSRSTGVLIADDEVLSVYNTGDVEMRWYTASELRMKTLLNEELCQSRLSARCGKKDVSALMLSDNMEHMAAFMTGGKRQKHKYDILNGAFRHFYYLTNDHAGEVLLRTLCDRRMRDTLDQVLTDGLSPRVPDASVENDGFDENGDPVLLGYLCDMPRILRFSNALTREGREGTLLCFDFQVEAIRAVCGESMTITPIYLESYEGSDIYRLEKVD